MRRVLVLMIVVLAGLSVFGSTVEAKRRVSVPSGSSSPCVEEDDEGNCLKRRSEVERERRQIERERRQLERSGESGQPSANTSVRTTRPRVQQETDSISWLYYGIAALIMFGGGVFKLLRRGVGVAASTVGSIARSKAETSTQQSSEWATRAASRFGNGPEPEPVIATPAASAPQRQPSMSPSVPVRRSGSGVTAPPRQVRSSGFGKSSDAPEPASEPLPAAVAYAPTSAAEPAEPARVALAAPARPAVPRVAGAARPRGGIQQRATFGMKR